MKSCAYCGRDNEDRATHCCECGTARFVFPTSPLTSSQKQTEREPGLPDPECDVPKDSEAALCTQCLFPNLPDASWCKRCGAPVSYAAIVGPQDAARASGFMWRGAVRGHPKRIVLVGVWFIFLPHVLAGLAGAFGIFILGLTSPQLLATFWLELLYGAVAFIMLYKVTRNYFTIPAKHLDEAIVT